MFRVVLVVCCGGLRVLWRVRGWCVGLRVVWGLFARGVWLPKGKSFLLCKMHFAEARGNRGQWRIEEVLQENGKTVSTKVNTVLSKTDKNVEPRNNIELTPEESREVINCQK